MVIHRGGKTALAMVPISQDAMDQRMGRAGRVSAGRCIRLWDERYRPQAVTAPELERMELDDVLLRAAICGLDGERLERAPWITPPPQFALARASARLMRRGASRQAARV
jgi:ATP-dependent helicase HrpB